MATGRENPRCGDIAARMSVIDPAAAPETSYIGRVAAHAGAAFADRSGPELLGPRPHGLDRRFDKVFVATTATTPDLPRPSRTQL